MAETGKGGGLRHFVYGRKDVKQLIRIYEVFINGGLLPFEALKEIHTCFSSDDPQDKVVLAAFRGGDAAGEGPAREFFLNLPLSSGAEWLFGKGTLERRGDEAVGFYDSYLFHGVLLNGAERERLSHNPFVLADALSLSIGDNRVKVEPLPPIPYPEEESLARQRALAALPAGNRPALLETAGRFVWNAAFGRPVLVSGGLEWNAAFWNLVFLLLPHEIRRGLALSTFRSFIHKNWHGSLFLASDTPCDAGCEARDILALPQSLKDLLFAAARASGEAEKAFLLDLVPEAISALRQDAKACDQAFAAAVRPSVGRLSRWPVEAVPLLRWHGELVKRAWERNRPDMADPGEKRAARWAVTFGNSAMWVNYNAKGAPEPGAVDESLFVSFAARLMPHMRREWIETSWRERFLEFLVKGAGGKGEGRNLFSALCDPAVPPPGEVFLALYEKLPAFRKSAFMRSFVRGYDESRSQLLAAFCADAEASKDLWTLAVALLSRAAAAGKDQRADPDLEKKILKLFTTCITMEHNNHTRPVRETIPPGALDILLSLLERLGPDWDGVRRAVTPTAS